MIYALVHPDTLEVRYIGKAKDCATRLRGHIKDARRSELPLYRWWRKLEREVGHPPSMVRLGEGDGAEEVVWIARLRSEGARLLNITAGGAGGATMTGRKHSPETREKIGAAQRGKPRPPLSLVARAKISKANRGRPKPEGFGARLSAALTGRTFSDAHLAAMSLAQRGHTPWNLGISHTEETKARISAALRGHEPTPGYTGHKHSAAAKEKMRVAREARRARGLHVGRPRKGEPRKAA